MPEKVPQFDRKFLSTINSYFYCSPLHGRNVASDFCAACRKFVRCSLITSTLKNKIFRTQNLRKFKDTVQNIFLFVDCTAMNYSLTGRKLALDCCFAVSQKFPRFNRQDFIRCEVPLLDIFLNRDKEQEKAECIIEHCQLHLWIYARVVTMIASVTFTVRSREGPCSCSNSG